MSLLEKLRCSAIVRLLLVAMLYCVLAVPLFFFLAFVSRWMGFGEEAPTLAEGRGLLFHLIAIGAYCVVALIVHLTIGLGVERKLLSEIGFDPEDWLADLGAGFAGGTALVLLMVGSMWALGWYRVLGVAVTGQPLPFAGLLGGTFVLLLVVAVGEEVLFRGILQRILEEGLGTVPAIVVSGLLFGVAHLMNPEASWQAALLIGGVGGTLLGLLYAYTRSLWAPIAAHWAWNFMEGVVLGLPVSGLESVRLLEAKISGPLLWTGGKFGPEAGLIALASLAPAILVLAVMVLRRAEFRAPLWYERRVAREARDSVLAMRMEGEAPEDP
ncbi:MAG: protease family protein [Candidatus Sumerlaeota bacterium]|nr:protease family protein [Candidatus Sumerlaeota bacterium]